MNSASTLHEFYARSPMREGVLCWYPFKNGSTAHDFSNGALGGLLKDRGVYIADENVGADYCIVIDPENCDANTLESYRKKLAAGGRLLLAYENPFALRYWAGASSPRTGMPYDTLFGRGVNPMPSKAELVSLLNRAGFNGQKWYYFVTDHWFTQEVYSDNFQPNDYFGNRVMPYIADDLMLQFDERWLYREVIRGGAFKFMCGAYLVEARVRTDDEPCVVDYAAVTAYRTQEKRFATTLRADGKAIKTPLHRDGVETLRRISGNHEELTRLGVKVVEAKVEDNSLVMPRLNLPTLLDYWAQKISGGSLRESEVFAQYDQIRDNIYKASAAGKCFWELVPANCFINEATDELTFFDQEYCWHGVSPDFAVARAILALTWLHAFNNEPRFLTWHEKLKERYGLADNWDEYMRLLAKTNDEVFGDGLQPLIASTEEAVGRLHRKPGKHRFLPAAIKMHALSVKRPAVYGYGRRGQAFCKVLEDCGYTDIVLIDRQIEKYARIEDVDAEYDAIIVSILHGDDIAAELRNKVNVPIYTLGELAGE